MYLNGAKLGITWNCGSQPDSSVCEMEICENGKYVEIITKNYCLLKNKYLTNFFKKNAL